MKKQWILSIVAVLTTFALGWASSPRVVQLLRTGPVVVNPHVQWASSAGTVAQQIDEADIVVRARVLKTFKPRVFENPLPGQTERFPSKFDVMAFSEALLKVEEVYQGDVRGNIRVVQTGGLVPENDNHPILQIELTDDPLLVKGAEHVFFLQEITGDSVLAPHRKLYRIVNSAGRYDISGEVVISHSDLPGKRPTRLKDLIKEIRAAS